MAMALSSISLTGCGFEFNIGSEKPIFSSEKKDTGEEKKTEAETEESDEIVETTEDEVEETTEEEEATENDIEETDSEKSSSQYSGYTMDSKMFHYVVGADKSDNMILEVFTDKKVNASDVDLKNLSDLINEKGVNYLAIVGCQDIGTATVATLFNAEDEGGEEMRKEMASQFGGDASDRDILDGHSFLRVSSDAMDMDTDDMDESCFSARIAMNGTKMYIIFIADENGTADKYMGDFIENMKFNGRESEHEIIDDTSSSNDSQFQSKALPEDTEISTEDETMANKSDHVVNVNVDTFKDGLTVEGNTIRLGQTTMNQFSDIMAKLGLSEDYSDDNSLGGKYIQYKSDGNNNCIVGMSGEGGTVYSVKVDFNSYGNHKNFEVDGIDASMTRDEAIKIFGEPDYTSDSLLQYNVGDTTFEVYFYDGKLSTVGVANYTID